MSHPKEPQVLQLREEGLSMRRISDKTGIPKSTIQRILVDAGKAGETEDPSIAARGQQWTAKLSPWIKLMHQAASEQIPECRSVSLDDFIYLCCDFVKRAFRLHPPGWALEMEPELDVSEPDGWHLPQVMSAARMLEREVESGREPAGSGSKATQSEGTGGESGQPGGAD